ncbi:hypothetical protein D1AOALGA4SA_12126 [Olavius algarvensis Delta 1 endosymbiont]|nr:hypothetical protein D1AOALGA4SA_12126 [Olavius algarvensis Delta 1 endosymbiont]
MKLLKYFSFLKELRKIIKHILINDNHRLQFDYDLVDDTLYLFDSTNNFSPSSK